MLGSNPNHTHDQSTSYLETIESVLDLYFGKGMFHVLLCGDHKEKTRWKLTRFRFQTVRETVLGQRLRIANPWSTLAGHSADPRGMTVARMNANHAT